jgi:predicted glutamine amidotransferase
MSRMIGFVTDRPSSPSRALGGDLLDSFLALSALHCDGWGYASVVHSDPLPRVSTGLGPVRAEWHPVVATSGLLYLRFASAGAAVTPENLQPFIGDGIAFAHNGALVPRELAERRLTDAERAALRGTTDSEVYFAKLRRRLAATGSLTPETLAAGVARVRALYPAACLNAMLLVGDALVVVHSPGTVAPPLAAFAARGVADDRLPPGHHAGYNVLATTRLATGARVVATSGVDTTGWQKLEADTVYAYLSDGSVQAARMPV